MKQFTNPPVRIKFPQLDVEEITKIDFVIKEKVERDAYPLAKARYPESLIEPDSDILPVTLDEEGAFSFQLTTDQTSHMPVDEGGRPRTLWLDSRVFVGDEVLNTPLQKIRIKPTLFSEDYEEEGGEW